MHIVWRQKGQREFENVHLNDGERVSLRGMEIVRHGRNVRIEKPILFGFRHRTIVVQSGNSVTVDGHLFFAGSTEHAVLRFISNQSFD